MKSQLGVLAVTVGLFCAATVFAQTAAPAEKARASVSLPAVPATKTPATPAAPMAKTGATPAAKTAAPTTAAAGGGDGKIWVNTKSKTYHCQGTKFYGKTKVGEYLTELGAKAKGNHPDHRKTCAK